MPYRQDLETGEWIEVDVQGNPVSRGQVLQNPTAPYEGPRAAADTRRAEAEARVASETTDAEIRLAQARAAEAQANAARATAELTAGSSSPGRKAADEAFAKDYVAWTTGGGMAGLESKLSMLSEAQDVLEGSDTITGPVFGRLPKFIQQMVNPASQDVRADVEKAIQESLRQVLGAQFTQKEGEGILARTFDPTQNEGSNARRTRNLINELRTKGAAIDDAARYFEDRGTITGWTAPRGNALTTSRIVGGPGPGAAEFMATTKGEPVNPEYQSEYTAWVRQNAGKFTPEQYAAFRTGLDQKYGYGATADYIAEGQRIADRITQGGSLNLDIPPNEQPMSGFEQFRNSAVSNPVGAGAAGFLDMGGFGGVSALAPEQMAALGNAQPVGMALGQIGGAITGTSALGALGRNTIGRAAPGLLGNGATAARGYQASRAGQMQFGRNIATDAAYSGLYGGVTGQDPLASAALGALGSVGGQGVGKLAGRAIGGLDVSPAVQRLRDAGVRLTTGQTLGGIPRRLEDAFTSMPGVGDIAGARRLEGLQDFNRAAFGEAGTPIGATTQNIGEEGVQELIGQYADPLDSGLVGAAYDRATAGVRVPLDPQFNADMRGVAQARNMLPDDYGARFDVVGQNRVAPIVNAGEMTGDAYQQAFRGLKASRSSAAGAAPGFEQEYRDALTKAMDAMTAQMERGGGDQVVTGLRNADQAYRGAKTLERAVRAARNGTGSGEIQTFTPAQLNTASTQAANKYGGGRQMAELIDAGQSTLPSTVPDSGTGRRLATLALPTALGGTAAGIGGVAGGGEGAQTGALSGVGLAALLALGGTRGGQAALNSVLTGRGPRAQILGRAMRKKSGLFGSASLPFLVTDY